MAPAFGPVEIPVTKLPGLGTTAGLPFQIPPPAKLAGIDNTLWTAGIDQSVIGNIRTPLKAIVVSQDPPAGTEVPFGTVVNITLASLDAIPLQILKDQAGLTFGTVGDFQAALAGDPALMASVSNATSFESLSADDQRAFTAFATQHGATDASRAFGAAKIVASL
jgi:hypothetical protein